MNEPDPQPDAAKQRADELEKLEQDVKKARLARQLQEETRKREDQTKPSNLFDRMLDAVVPLIGVVAAAAVVAYIIMLVWTGPAHVSRVHTVVLGFYPRQSPEITVLQRANRALDQAERASDSADRVINFLQGASVLIAAALGAAAIYGFRNTRETRQELRAEMAELRAMKAEIDEHRDDLKKLPEQLETIEATRSRVDRTLHNFQQNFVDLLQANQELLLKNYREAYNAICKVLDREGDNPDPMALYIAGWLEIQQIEGVTLEQAEAHLQRALKIAPDWPSALAVYGVVKRRQGLESTATKRERFFDQAAGLLRQALGQNPALLDFNRESLRGPLAGIYRDSGEYDLARNEYEKACKVTPGSSYPRGNLAALFLREARLNPNADSRQRALSIFEWTADLARAELALEPNDYYLMMDISMSKTILSYDQTYPLGKRYEIQSRYLKDTLNMEGITTKQLGVSLRGWTFLHDNCPDGDEWQRVRQYLLWSLQKVCWAIVRTHLDNDTAPGADHMAETLAALHESVAMPELPESVLNEWAADWAAVADSCPAGEDWTTTRESIQQARDIIAAALDKRQSA